MTTRKAAATATLGALLLTAVMAWPVLRAPSTRTFGPAIDGPHHDAYTVMWQFAHARPAFPYRQPLVDDAGALAARAVGPVAALNLVVLLSFPLSALAAFLLARYLRLSHGAAAIAAFAFAFAPLHLAHAAYHPHVMQAQWLPVYFLALWACVDRATPLRAVLAIAAGAAVALSNFYGAFAVAVLTPVAVAARLTARPEARRGRRHTLALVSLAAAGPLALLTARATMPALFESFAASRDDVARYGAQWFAYAVPPVEHPIWGARAASFWDARGMTGALVEQQVSISWALAALALVAVVAWARARGGPRTSHQPGPLYAVPALALVALAAMLCSIAPPPEVRGAATLLPAHWLYPFAPMFRAYARFAFVAHLMLALLAAIGVMCLWPQRRALAAALLLIATVEYAPPVNATRDVLPTAAHRWLAGRPRVRALDCTPPSLAGTHLPWLMQQDIEPLGGSITSCDGPGLATAAAARGIRYVIVRSPDDGRPAPPGLALAGRFPDSRIYDVVVPPS